MKISYFKKLKELAAFAPVLFCLSATVANATAIQLTQNRFSHPFYVGVVGGYGTTTWGGLVSDDINAAMSFSTPISVKEGGGVWGVYTGYEILPTFGFEAGYMHYPDATIIFDPTSLFTFEHDGITQFNTKTESVNLVAKLMMIIPHSNVRIYSTAGAAGVHRNDMIKDSWSLRPTFGVGFNYNFTDHMMVEVGGEYIAGNGKSEINPAENYIPFLYSGFVRLAYRC